jgi:hypothetical protein
VTPTATRRLRTLRDCRVIRAKLGVRYDGIEELARSGMLTSRPVADRKHVDFLLTPYGDAVARTLPSGNVFRQGRRVPNA